MNPIHDTLTAVLAAIRPSAVPAPQRDALNKFKQEVIQLLQQRFPLHHERVGEPRTIGSKEKGTDTALGCDLDLIVPFKHGYRTNPKGMKAEVLAALQKHFPNPPTLVRDQRVSVGLRRRFGNVELGIDVVPGMEKKPNTYNDKEDDEDSKYLVLYDRESNCERSTNIHRQARLIRSEAEYYRDTVRLLKAWRHKHSHAISSYALELLVYQASRATGAPETGSPEVLLSHVLVHSIPLLERDDALQDIGANYMWTDYLKPGAKTQLAGLWKKLLAALRSGNAETLKAYFP